MKKSYVTAALILMCLLGVGLSAHAQDADAVVVSVPFEFVAGAATLPAGEYKVSRVDRGVTRELAISGYNRGGALLLASTFDEGAVVGPTLSFEHVGGKYFLTEVTTLSGIYTMPPSREMVMLVKANSPSPSTLSASGSQ